MASASQGRETGIGSTTGSPISPGMSSPSTSFGSASRASTDSGSAGASSADSLKEGLKDTAITAGGVLRDQATQLAQDIGHELSRTGESQIARGADAIRRFARAIDNAASELEDQSPTVARSVHEAAHKVNRLSDNIASRNLSELLDSATQLARAQPVLFLGGSVFAGIALARFLKSSARHRPGSGAVSSGSVYQDPAQTPY